MEDTTPRLSSKSTPIEKLKSFIVRLQFNSSADRRILNFLWQNLCVVPKKMELYHVAFRHKSSLRENEDPSVHSNERLEYLGDAILDAVVSDYLFGLFPEKDEGYLTKVRSKIVSRAHLNAWARKLGIGNLIVQRDVEAFKHSALLGNALEAVFGALYLDKGYTYSKKKIILLLEQSVNIEELIHQIFDYKSRLLEWGQKERKRIDYEWLEASKSMENHSVQVKVNGEKAGSGEASSKRKAEQMASKEAMQKYNLL